MHQVFALLSATILSTVIASNPIFKVNTADPLYTPDWKSLDSRLLPSWYDESKIGIFIHWGVYSVPGYLGEWFWKQWTDGDKDAIAFMKANYRPHFTYQDFANDFTAEFFDGEKWADLLAKSGAKYVVLTSKHHDGYTLWPSQYSFSWNSRDVGPNRDLIGEFITSIRNRTNLHAGLYHSLYEWFNPMYLEDKKNEFTTQVFVQNKIIPEMMELINNYQPDILWSDGEWEASDLYWQSKQFLAWLYNESPVKDTVVVNDRWGNTTLCKHGGYYTCKDRYNPGVLQHHKWENAMTLDKLSWGFRRNMLIEEVLSSYEVIATLIQTVSCGGNILINVGPTKEGWIPPIFQERLLDLGSWLQQNGEAIYGTSPWKFQNDTLGSAWYTSKNSDVYAITLDWPANNILELELAAELFNTSKTVVNLLGFAKPLKWQLSIEKVQVIFPDKAVLPGQWARALGLETPLKWQSSSKKVQITFPDKAVVPGQWAWALKIH